MNTVLNKFSMVGKVAAITGGGGVLGGQMGHVLAAAGAKVAIIDLRKEKADERANAIKAEGGDAIGVEANVLDMQSIETCLNSILAAYGKLDVLINAAGGNMPGATIGPNQTFFDLEQDAFMKVLSLNLQGTVLPTQVIAKHMAEKKSGVIINISSMSAQRPLTRVVGYSAAKAAIDNFTKWISTELAQKYGEGIRCNAIAPGFFIGDQNRALLLNDDGSLTARGQTILNHTPMGRFGEPDDLSGTLLWLCSDASKFVTGIVVPVDGGFSAFSGV